MLLAEGCKDLKNVVKKIKEATYVDWQWSIETVV